MRGKEGSGCRGLRQQPRGNRHLGRGASPRRRSLTQDRGTVAARIGVSAGIAVYLGAVFLFADPVEAIAYTMIGAVVGMGAGYLAGRGSL